MHVCQKVSFKSKTYFSWKLYKLYIFTLKNIQLSQITGKKCYDNLHITSVIFNFQIKEHLFPEKNSVRREEKKNETYHSG